MAGVSEAYALASGDPGHALGLRFDGVQHRPHRKIMADGEDVQFLYAARVHDCQLDPGTAQINAQYVHSIVSPLL